MTSKAHQKEKHTTKGKLWLKTRLVHQCFIDIHISILYYATTVCKRESLVGRGTLAWHGMLLEGTLLTYRIQGVTKQLKYIFVSFVPCMLRRWNVKALED